MKNCWVTFVQGVDFDKLTLNAVFASLPSYQLPTASSAIISQGQIDGFGVFLQDGIVGGNLECCYSFPTKKVNGDRATVINWVLASAIA